MSITITSRKDFVENITKLSLWLAREYHREGMVFKDAITIATPVYRFTTLWDGINHPAEGYVDNEWNKVIVKLENDLKENSNSLLFEENGLKLLKPILEVRYKTDVDTWPWIPSTLGATNLEERLSGMFLYELNKKNELDLHMGNIYAPDSPFKDMERLKKSLQLLVENVIKQENSVDSIVCESWMNSFEPFLSLFPKEWCKHSSKTNMKNYTYDIWGQMMNRSGGYHKPNGDYLRQHGEFPYPSIRCGCSVKSLLQHLQ